MTRHAFTIESTHGDPAHGDIIMKRTIRVFAPSDREAREITRWRTAGATGIRVFEEVANPQPRRVEAWEIGVGDWIANSRTAPFERVESVNQNPRSVWLNFRSGRIRPGRTVKLWVLPS